MPSEQFSGLMGMLSAAKQNRPEEGMGTEEWRTMYDSLGGMVSPPEDVTITPVTVGGVSCEWHVPSGKTDRTIVYVHGGGYVIGSLNSHRGMLAHFAVAAQARVLAVDYRLAPEHPHPGALEDALAAYEAVLAEGTAPSKVVIGGDSAGGGLTLATLMALRDAGKPLPAAGVCFSPWADLALTGESLTTRADKDPLVVAEDLQKWISFYVDPSGKKADDPAITPINGDFSGLPPLFVAVGTNEVLYDDAARVVEKAKQAGIETAFDIGEDMIHVWQFFPGMFPEADAGLEKAAAFIKAHT